MCVNVDFDKFRVMSDGEHSRQAEHIRVSLCNAKIEATIRDHLLRGMKLERQPHISNHPGM